MHEAGGRDIGWSRPLDMDGESTQQHVRELLSEKPTEPDRGGEDPLAEAL